jgi:hypothetical protein
LKLLALKGSSKLSGTVVGSYNVTEQLLVATRRRAARAIFIDDLGRHVLIKRTKPGQPPYWTAPGDGVEDTDTSAGLRQSRVSAG